MMNQAYETAIREFASVAEQFCRVLERRHELSFEDFVWELDEVLPRCYLSAHRLIASAPDDIFDLATEITFDEAEFEELIQGDDTMYDSQEDALARELRDIFGNRDQHYIGVNYTHPSAPGQPVNGELPDTEVLFESTSTELAAMYESLRTTLTTFRSGDIDEAGREWQSDFYAVWGEFLPHLLGEAFRLAHATISIDEKDLGP
jgi:hypothetical protein